MYKVWGGEQNINLEIRLMGAYRVNKKMETSNGILAANVFYLISSKSKTKEFSTCLYLLNRIEYYFNGTTFRSMSDFRINHPSPAFGRVRV